MPNSVDSDETARLYWSAAMEELTGGDTLSRETTAKIVLLRSEKGSSLKEEKCPLDLHPFQKGLTTRNIKVNRVSQKFFPFVVVVEN